MKYWLRLAASATLFLALAVNAQSIDERKALRLAVDSAELSTLAAQFQRQFEADEARVRLYLLDNPGQQRSEVKNGVSHTIVRIDAAGKPVFQAVRDGNAARGGTTKNKASGELIKADSLYPGGSIGVSITGAGMVGGVWEPSAVRETHELLTGHATNQPGQVASVTAGDRDHAAHVTGTMVGKDIASQPTARGIAFGAFSQNFDSANDLTEMTTFAAGGFLISNHSYGDPNTQTADLWKYGAYDAEARGWDALTKAAPAYLPFIAVGNEQTSSGNTAKAGYDIITGSAAAKNVMTVGGVNGDKTMSDYSNWGPTDDGRVKPEIVAKGTGINSAQATSDTAYSGNGAGSSGTSYAAPAAAAAGLLLQQYYNSLHGSYMKASTLKALMLGTAEDLGNPGPDHKFGWGLLNVENAALAIKKRTPSPSPGSPSYSYVLGSMRGSVIEEITVNPTNDSSSEISRNVFAKGGVPLVINIAWTDDEGIEQTAGEGIDPTASRLVYNFDILVRQSSPSLDTRPWVVPSMANRTAAATVATGWFQSNGGNFRQVIIANPVADGLYRIFMRKSSGSPAAMRIISLVITGVSDKINGVCGTANGVPTLTAPSTNLCSAGIATGVTSGTDSFTWSCNGENGGTSVSCSAPRRYIVTASAGANGTLSCTSPVNAGSTTSCTAVPGVGYATQSISGCGGAATGPGINSYTTGNISADCTVTAAFQLNTYTVTGTASPVAGGTVTCTPNPVNSGGSASCTASANAGFTFSAFSGDCTGATCNLTNITANKAVVATFTANTYTVTGTASPVAGGTVTCTPNPVNSGGSASCTASANAGFTFSAFSGDCTGATCNLTNITANKAVVATFTANTYTVTGTASPVAGGTVTCTPNPVNSGGSASCTASANAGFTFSAFSGDCTGATCNLTNITANKAVVATFTPVQTFAGSTSTGSGPASASFTGGGGTCRFDPSNTAFVAASVANPAGSFPHGWFKLRLIGCTPGATVRVSIVWPAISGAYAKYGKTPTSAGVSVFYQPPGLAMSGNTVGFDVIDGGLGDDDLSADGIINDPSGPVLVAPVVPVPTLSELALALLALMLAAVAFVNRRRLSRQSA